MKRVFPRLQRCSTTKSVRPSAQPAARRLLCSHSVQLFSVQCVNSRSVAPRRCADATEQETQEP